MVTILELFLYGLGIRHRGSIGVVVGEWDELPPAVGYRFFMPRPDGVQ